MPEYHYIANTDVDRIGVAVALRDFIFIIDHLTDRLMRRLGLIFSHLRPSTSPPVETVTLPGIVTEASVSVCDYSPSRSVEVVRLCQSSRTVEIGGARQTLKKWLNGDREPETRRGRRRHLPESSRSFVVESMSGRSLLEFSRRRRGQKRIVERLTRCCA